MRKFVGKAVAVAGAVLVPVVAMATEPTGVDVSAVVSNINANLAGLVSIGGAVLGIVYGVRVFSWARKI